MKEKILSEDESLQLALYPLCTVTNQTVIDDFTESNLRTTMSINDIVEAKIQYGVEPHLKEYQFCTLPYDLPDEVWKPFPGSEGRHLISNKCRVKSLVLNGTISHQRRHGEVGLQDINRDKKSITVCPLAWKIFGDEIIPPYPNTKKQRLINHKIRFNHELTYEDYRDNLSLIDMPGEIWLPLNKYSDYYCISNMGRAKSLTASYTRKNTDVFIELSHILAQANIPGYYAVHLIDRNGKHVLKYVHHLVMEAFQPRTQDDIDMKRIHIDHINGNKHDNRYANLRYLTVSENIRASNNMGKGNTKLKIDVVKELGHEYEIVKNARLLGEKYGVGDQQIMKAVKGITFSDVSRYIPKI